jgi:NAD(P)-dependent dehydrogenase (short-subunit alcohol dehydrogenase family)
MNSACRSTSPTSPCSPRCARSPTNCGRAIRASTCSRTTRAASSAIARSRSTASRRPSRRTIWRRSCSRICCAIASSAGASVIQTSSVAARRFSRFDIDDLNAERRYSASSAYGNAKLANILFTREIVRRWGDDGVAAAAFHPGVIGSSFASTAKGPWRFLYTSPVTSRLLTSTDVGGARLAWLALGKPGLDWERRLLRRQPPRANLAAGRRPVIAARLWERSADMVGL